MNRITGQIEALATVILNGFDKYRREFQEITLGAQDRFEREDWVAVQNASMARIELYRRSMREILNEFQEVQGDTNLDMQDWHQIKAAFESKILSRRDFDLAETVYNTIFRNLHHRSDLTDQGAFVREPIKSLAPTEVELTHHFGPTADLSGLLRQVVEGYPFNIGFQDLEGDIALLVDLMKTHIPLLRTPQEIRFEILKPVFYRNKGAYLIGKMFIGEHLFPVAIPIHNEGGLYLDTILWNENDLSVIFSFTRSYFMAHIEDPIAMVRFLNDLLPNKKTWELYTGVGFYKHGKTEFYRGFLDHLEHSDDQFVIARGIKGLVMCVFTLPSYQTVFKIIKDKFSPTKKITRHQVREAYYLVKTHDRVGRMADTQEFNHFEFPRDRFDPALLEELQKVCASSLELTDDTVVISHLYAERLMTPLNLYVDGKSEFELRATLDEYGNAIKQLAAANIFPGDMLMKNFGVTRHGRVVFYDYDEICYLTEVNFRKIPQNRGAEDAMAAMPWFDVGPQDVFPEEFGTFMFSSSNLKDIFCELHGDLFTAEYWQEVQDNIRSNRVMDVYPYRQNRRLERSRH